MRWKAPLNAFQIAFEGRLTTGRQLTPIKTGSAVYWTHPLLDVYAEVYAKEAQTDPFCAVDRFAEGLTSWMTHPNWTCVVGYDHGQPVGYAYGAPLYPASGWWGGLLTDVPAGTITETGTRTYALSELMVRTPWQDRHRPPAPRRTALHPARAMRHAPGPEEPSQGPGTV